MPLVFVDDFKSINCFYGVSLLYSHFIEKGAVKEEVDNIRQCFDSFDRSCTIKAQPTASKSV